MAELDRALRSDAGWWVELVVGEFQFLLDDFGWALHEVTTHFRGNGVSFRGAGYVIDLEYDPESRVLAGTLWRSEELSKPSGPAPIALPSLLRERQPRVEWLDPQPGSDLPHDEVAAVVGQWARGVREVLPDILRSDPVA
jgi:hypothetical protein